MNNCGSRKLCLLYFIFAMGKFYLLFSPIVQRYYLFLQCLMRVAQLVIKTILPCGPRKYKTDMYIFTYDKRMIKNQLRNHFDLNDHIPY